MQVDEQLMRDIRSAIYSQLASAWDGSSDTEEFQAIPVKNGLIPNEYLPGGDKYYFKVNNWDKSLHGVLERIDEALLNT